MVVSDTLMEEGSGVFFLSLTLLSLCTHSSLSQCAPYSSLSQCTLSHNLCYHSSHTECSHTHSQSSKSSYRHPCVHLSALTLTPIQVTSLIPASTLTHDLSYHSHSLTQVIQSSSLCSLTHDLYYHSLSHTHSHVIPVFTHS